MGISDFHARESRGEHEHFTLVRLDDPAWGGGVRGNDVHFRVEGALTQRGDVEGPNLRGKVTENTIDAGL